MSNYLWLPIAAMTAIAVASALGIFKPRRILGPSRLSPRESPRVILRVLGFALGTWAICIMALGSIHQAKLKRQGQPANSSLSEAETVVYSGVTELAVLAIMLAATIATRPDGVRRTGINPRRIPKGVFGGILGIAIAFPLILYVNGFTVWALEYWNKSNPPHELLEILANNPSAWLKAAVVISAGVVAPIAEEMFFRGVLQTLVRNLFKSSWLAILFAAAAFAMVHHWTTWPQIFFLGFCLGYAYERTGNLWMSITMHALFNLTSIWSFTHWG